MEGVPRPPGPIGRAKMNFVLQPVNIRDSGVTIQLFVDSATRPRAFVGILSLTTDEFIGLRGVLEKGTSGKGASATLIIHPLLDAIGTR